MNTPSPISLSVPSGVTYPFGMIVNAGIGGVVGAVSVVVNEVARMEHAPLAYYAAFFGGLSLVVSVIKVWSWVSEQWKREIQLSEIRMTGEIRAVETRVNAELRQQFSSFQQLEEERHTRIEQMIELLRDE